MDDGGVTINGMMAWGLLLTVISALLGHWLSRVSASQEKRIEEEEKLRSRMTALEILVAGQYVRRPEFQETVTQIHAKLDRLLLERKGSGDG